MTERAASLGPRSQSRVSHSCDKFVETPSANGSGLGSNTTVTDVLYLGDQPRRVRPRVIELLARLSTQSFERCASVMGSSRFNSFRFPLQRRLSGILVHWFFIGRIVAK